MHAKKFRYLWLALLPASIASATVLQPIALRELVRDADVIVRGRVVHVETVGNDPAFVRTCATLEIDEAFKGSIRGQLRVCERGGALPSGQTLVIAGTPRYLRGSAVLALLSARPDGTFRTFGFSQGLFHIVRDTYGNPQSLVRELEDVSWLTENGTVADQTPANVATRLVAHTVFAQIRAWVGGAE